MPPRVTNTRQLFAKGQVTDLDTSDLAPDQAEALRDAVWSANGDLAKRGAFLYASAANPLNGRTTKITGVCVLPDENSSPQTYRIVVGEHAGHIGVLSSYSYTPGTANTSATTSSTLNIANSGAFGMVYPLVAYQGEVIVAMLGKDMVTPTAGQASSILYRWAGNTTTFSSFTGTVSATAGEDTVTGVGTLFTTEAAVNAYLYVADSTGVKMSYRITSIESNTRLRVSSPIQVTVAGVSYSIGAFGLFNIASLVTTKGRSSNSTTTQTGQATTWNSGLDRVKGNTDWMSDAAGAARVYVTSVASDTSIGTSTALALTNAKYRICRPLAGRIVTQHAGRLWVAGVPWAPNRLQVTPAGFQLGDAFNGVDSTSTAIGLAGTVESVEIPSPYDPGRIVALEAGNDPGPLLVLRDTDAYVVYGEWPSVQVTKLGDNIGCVHQFASCASEHGFFWAGSDGVYQYRPGGGVRDLTEGRVNREWRAFVKSLAGNATFQVSVEVVDSWLVISAAYGSETDTQVSPPNTFPSTQYVYDIDRDAWGTWTGPNVLGMSTVFIGGKPREVIATDYSTNRLVTLSGAMDPTLAGSANGVNGTFLARSGRMLLGSAGQLGRVIGARLTYRMTGSSPQFTVKFGSTSLQTAATVTTTTTGTAYATTRLRPTLNLGSEFRDVQVEFAESSGTPTRLELNEFQWVTRERRVRA